MKYTFSFLLFCLFFSACNQTEKVKVPRWGIFETQVINENSYDDPFRDVDLEVICFRPDGSELSMYGYYDGDKSWAFRCMPDMEGEWEYKFKFSDGSRTGSGSFICSGMEGPGMVSVNEKNPVWMGFKESEPVQLRSFHVGDRFFASNFDRQTRETFLDWAGDQGYNLLSIGSFFMNRNTEGRGAGWDTPELWPLNVREYRNLEVILSGLKERRIMVFPFAGFFGRSAKWPVDHADQELYIKYTLARLSAYWNLLFNVAGPEPLLRPEDFSEGRMTRQDINRLAVLINKYDPYGHVLSVHNRTRDPETGEWELDPFISEPWEDYAVLQGAKGNDLTGIYDFIMDSRKQMKPVYAQEVLWHGNMYHGELTEQQMRKKAIILIMAGAFINFGDMNGNSSSGFSSHMLVDSASRERHYIMHQVWDFFDSIPFHELEPRPDLVDQGYCLAREGYGYLVYLDQHSQVNVDLIGKVKEGYWIDARDFSRAEIEIKEMLPNTFSIPDMGDWFLWIRMK